MRQQMGAAAAATATAMVNAAKSGPRGAQQEIDPSKLHFRECAGEKWIDTSLSEWPDSAPPTRTAPRALLLCPSSPHPSAGASGTEPDPAPRPCGLCAQTTTASLWGTSARR